MTGLSIDAIRLRCPDVAATAAFWRAAFGCAGPDCKLSLGRQRVALVQATGPPGPPAPSNSTAFQHYAIVVRDMNRAMGRLGQTHGWTSISRAGPELLPPTSGGVTAFKFRDPDGHPLEFLQFRRRRCRRHGAKATSCSRG